jgi:DNA polymerase elongation subunit (family B)
VYRNVAYSQRTQTTYLYTWDDSGKRVTLESTYEPYIYLETNNAPDTLSIFNTKLKKKKFRNQSDRSRYIKDNNIKRVFDNFNVQQQFLIDAFWQDNEKDEFSQHPLKVYFIDIETYSPDAFPDINNPQDPINVITIYDTITDRYTVWGTKPFTKANEKTDYIYCKTERELFAKFLDFFSKDYPDILSGWNSEFFDIPYIVNRMTKILGEDETRRLSPIGSLRARTFMGKFGREQTRWHIEGISCVDYLQIYQRFCPVLRESYKLDAIGEIELDQRKIDYGDTDLASLSEDNWELFVEYNIQDVTLLINLEKKLQYIQLLRMIAYAGLTTFEGALGSLSVITGLCSIRARTKNQRIPTFVKETSEANKKNAGAYVGEPQRDFQEHVVSFDANSLYPNMMITLNLSPETKIGTILHDDKYNILYTDDGKMTIKHVNGTEYNITREKFVTFVKHEQIAISKARVLFSQKEKGIVPITVDHYYKKRVELKKLLTKAKKAAINVKETDPNYKKIQNEIDNLNIRQHTIKILINTIYGYFGNKHSPLGDDDLANSITLTGQAVIKQSNDILTNYIKDNTGLSEDYLKENSPIIYNDTDSSYISIKHLIKSKNIATYDKNGNVTADYYKAVQDIEDHLNTEIVKWGKADLNSIDCRLVFKREAIADSGVFLQKKRYVLHLLDVEGIPCNKFKYTGVEVVRTTMPAQIKPYVKRIIETMLTTKSLTETNKIFNETYEVFKTLPVEDIASVMGIKGYEKYANNSKEFDTVKRMPIHVKAAYYHNLLLEKFNIERKYESLSSGDKIRYFYVRKPNKYGISVIGYKYYYPKEFAELFEPDYEFIFKKIIFQVIERFYEAVNWRLKDPAMAVQTDLFDLLGMN